MGLTGETTSSEIALSSKTLGEIFSNDTQPIGRYGLSSSMLRYSETSPAVCTKHMAPSTWLFNCDTRYKGLSFKGTVNLMLLQTNPDNTNTKEGCRNCPY